MYISKFIKCITTSPYCKRESEVNFGGVKTEVQRHVVSGRCQWELVNYTK